MVRIFIRTVSYLLDYCSFIMKLVLECVRNFSVGCIQTGHRNLPPPQVYGRSLRGWQFFYFTYHHQYINWIQSSYSSYSSFQLCRWVSTKRAPMPIGLITCIFSCYILRLLVLFSCLWIIACFYSRPKGHKLPLG